ncbi:MAG: GldG family protein [Oscillospiraceae bacterium]
MKDKMNSRKHKFGRIAAFTTIVVVVALVAANVLATLLTNRFSLELDLTRAKAFVVSEPVRAAFEGVDAITEVTVLYNENDFITANPYFAQVDKILRTAADVNEKITYRYVDPVESPDITSKYPTLKATRGNIIIENKVNSRVVEIETADLFYMADETTIQSSRAEEVLASRIVSLTAKDSVEVAFSKGHGESATASFKSLFSVNNYMVSEVDTMTETIGENVRLLTIVAPKTDFSMEEIKLLENYLYNGGQYGKSIAYFASLEQPNLPNLSAFLAGYGMKIRDEMVYERDTTMTLGDDYRYTFVNYLEKEYAKTAINAQLRTWAPFSRPVDILFADSGSVRTQAILGFSPEAITTPVASSEQIKPEDIKSGETLYNAVVSTQYVRDGAVEKTSTVTVFGSDTMVLDTTIDAKNFGNAEFMLGFAEKVAPNAVSLGVAPKSITGSTMTLTSSVTTMLGVLFVGIVPAIVLIAGLIVFFRRRDK